MKAIIIGGGIGGLTTAIALRKAGIDAEIYERAPEIKEAGAGIALWPNALKALYQLKLESALDSVSCSSPAAEVRSSDGTVLSRTSAAEMANQFGVSLAIVHRAEFVDMLREAAADIPIRLGHRFRSLEQDARGATVHFENGQHATGDVVIGADGLRSAVRACLGFPIQLHYTGYAAWRAVVPYDTSRIVAGETLGHGCRFGMAPLRGNRVYWYATLNMPEYSATFPRGTKPTMLELFGRWHNPIPEIIHATAARDILHTPVYDRDPDGRWGFGRVTLLGDAAHAMTPDLGQGACQAIEDAMVLARCMADARSVADGLRCYAAERFPRTSAIVEGSRRVARIGQVETPLLCRLRDGILRAMPAWATLRQLAPIVGYERHLWAGGSAL